MRLNILKSSIASFLLSISLPYCFAPSENYIKKYRDLPFAPSYASDDIKNLKYLGSKLIDGGVSFNLYSENAVRCELLLFDNPNSEYSSQVFEMSRLANVYTIFIEGIGAGHYYGFRLWGPNWPYDANWYAGSDIGYISDVDSKGNRFNPNKIMTDPYARAFHRDHDWTTSSTASGPDRFISTVSASAKSIVVDDDLYIWSDSEEMYWSRRQNSGVRTPEKMIIYEANLKGLTKNSASGVLHPGTYLGVGEKAAYFAELGITAIEFLPVHEKPVDGGYWGYWTVGFFAPENSYAYNSEFGNQIEEFKWMVEQLHAYDIEVWIDVVYNHTGEGGLWRQKIPNTTIVDPDNPADFWNYDPIETATLINFRGIDNAAYYQLNSSEIDNSGNKDFSGDKDGFYWEHTGVGNGVRANHIPGRQLILDSLRFWNDTMHVDGFRFDLASQLGELDMDYTNWSATTTVLQDIIDDPVLQRNNARIVAEPWDAGGHYTVGQFSKSSSYDSTGYAWHEWNGQYRDVLKAFVNDEGKLLSDVKDWPKACLGMGGALTGSAEFFNDGCADFSTPRKPYHSINFVTAHDGFTMYDLFSYDEKRNGLGPLNPDGVDVGSGDNDNHSKNWCNGCDDGEALKRQIYRNMAVLLFISHGVPMMLGGDEWMRTQYGNNNAYTTGADNEFNWFRWDSWVNDQDRKGMFEFYKKLIQFRKDHCQAFCRTEWETDDGGENDLFSWRSTTNSDTPNWNSRSIALHYWNLGKELFIAVNLETFDVEFTLPENRNWIRIVDTQSFFESDGNFFSDSQSMGATYTLKARTIVIFEEE